MLLARLLLSAIVVAATWMAFSSGPDSNADFVGSLAFPSTMGLDPFDSVVLQGTQFAWEHKFYEEGADFPPRVWN